jgi:hypothetical protein
MLILPGKRMAVRAAGVSAFSAPPEFWIGI